MEASMNLRDEPKVLRDPIFYLGIALAGSGALMAYGLAMGSI